MDFRKGIVIPPKFYADVRSVVEAQGVVGAADPRVAERMNAVAITNRRASVPSAAPRQLSQLI
jgi:hypothetical protein